MKKLTVIIFSIILTPSSFAESYICSAELSRFSRTGEIETSVIERTKDGFNHSMGDFTISREISYESESSLILTSISVYQDLPYMGIVFIDKNTKEFGNAFLSMEEFVPDVPDPFTYGKCVVVN